MSAPGAPLFLAPDISPSEATPGFSGGPFGEPAEPVDPGELALADRAWGTVSRFHRQRGFGFITADTDGAQVFVHYTQLLDPPDPDGWRRLTPGQRVVFTRVEGNGGDRATGVRTL